jgi:hypothetical protein
MKKVRLVLALASSFVASTTFAGIFADNVVSYSSGTGFAAGYTNPAVALGQPNPNTPFGPVMPFNPPFASSEMVSLGVNGSLTVSFLTPILNNPSNPFGLDFIIYGSAGFVDNDYPNSVTDPLASMFSNNTGATRVSVSSDGINFFTLNPSLAPVVDGLFPTDGAGTFGLPVNPLLGPGDLGNLTLAQLRALYGGSAGGTGFDLAWAVDNSNQPVNLPSITQIRVDVLSGRSEIDGFAAVVPEPTIWTFALMSVAFLYRRRALR